MAGEKSYNQLNVIPYERRGDGRKKTAQHNGRAKRTNTGNIRAAGGGRPAYGNPRAGTVYGNAGAGGRNRRAAGNGAAYRGAGAYTHNGNYEDRARRRLERQKRRKRRVLMVRFACILIILLLAGGTWMGIYKTFLEKEQQGESKVPSLTGFVETIVKKEESKTIEEIFALLEAEGISCTQDFLTVNEYSRPADKLERIKNIFVHYTANPGTSAAQNRSYFENLGITHETSASSHFIIGYNGEIVQCIPLEEIAYAVAGRNEDSVSIECCYLDGDGEFTEETYNTLVHFAAHLLKKFGLDAEDMRRHYDEGGKLCPKYYVENEKEWEKFIKDVKAYKDML